MDKYTYIYTVYHDILPKNRSHLVLKGFVWKDLGSQSGVNFIGVAAASVLDTKGFFPHVNFMIFIFVWTV